MDRTNDWRFEMPNKINVGNLKELGSVKIIRQLETFVVIILLSLA